MKRGRVHPLAKLTLEIKLNKLSSFSIAGYTSRWCQCYNQDDTIGGWTFNWWTNTGGKVNLYSFIAGATGQSWVSRVSIIGPLGLLVGKDT